MWVHLKQNLELDKSLVKDYLISPSEKKRLSEVKQDSQVEFFKLAGDFLQNGARTLVALSDFVKTTNEIEYSEKKVFERIYKRIENLQMNLKLSDLEKINELIQKVNDLGFNKVKKESILQAYSDFNILSKLKDIEKLIETDEEDLPKEVKDLIESYKIAREMTGANLIALNTYL